MGTSSSVSITSIWVSLLLLTFGCASLNANPFNSKSGSGRDTDDDCEMRLENGRWEWYPEGCNDDLPISTGWIIAIAIVAFILTIVVPIAICFCFGCLCFKAFKRSRKPQGVVYAQQHTAPGQTYPNAYPQQPGFQQTNQPYPTAGNHQSPPSYGFVSNQQNN